MSASRIKIDGKPVLKLNIHQYETADIPFLSKLGINNSEPGRTEWLYAHIHSQQEFLATREAILQRFEVVEERGPKVFLHKKKTLSTGN